MQTGDTSDRASSGRIALALSGGGSRAMAFHLGCLRALRAEGLLDEVVAISAVSGGSVLAALYCSHPGSFDEFERSVRAVLASGFVRPALSVAFTTAEGCKAALSTIPLLVDRMAALAARIVIRPLPIGWRPSPSWLRESPLHRWASRTTILQSVFDE